MLENKARMQIFGTVATRGPDAALLRFRCLSRIHFSFNLCWKVALLFSEISGPVTIPKSRHLPIWVRGPWNKSVSRNEFPNRETILRETNRFLKTNWLAGGLDCEDKIRSAHYHKTYEHTTTTQISIIAYNRSVECRIPKWHEKRKWIHCQY